MNGAHYGSEPSGQCSTKRRFRGIPRLDPKACLQRLPPQTDSGRKFGTVCGVSLVGGLGSPLLFGEGHQGFGRISQPICFPPKYKAPKGNRRKDSYIADFDLVIIYIYMYNIHIHTYIHLTGEKTCMRMP